MTENDSMHVLCWCNAGVSVGVSTFSLHGYSNICAQRSQRASSWESSTKMMARFSWEQRPTAQFWQQSQSKQHRSVSLYRITTPFSKEESFKTWRMGRAREHPNPHPNIMNDPEVTTMIGTQSSRVGAVPTHRNKMTRPPAAMPDKVHMSVVFKHNF